MIGSLCTGYGGLDMAVEAVTGMSTAWHVEYDAAPSLILAHRWPGVPNHGDVWHTDWQAVAPVECLTAGYPCQPFSNAGYRRGEHDERHLWPGIARAVGVLRPRLIVLENVAGHVSLGLPNVVGDLASLGYDAAWTVVRASDAGAPHHRARLFIVAVPDAAGGQQPRTPADGDRVPVAAQRGRCAVPDASDHGQHADDTVRPAPEHAAAAGGVGVPAPVVGSGTDWGAYGAAVRRWERVLGRAAPVPVEQGKSGPRLSPAFVEWMMGLPAGHVTGVPGLGRNAQLKALGNGVVPQQAVLALRSLLPVVGWPVPGRLTEQGVLT